VNQRLPSLRAADVVRALQRAGFAVSRTSGSHCRLVHSIDPTRKVTVPLHGSSDLKRGTLRSIIAQAGLTVAEFAALL
jgi:predicted RNA binding protein YcfA (HicA-like mRNA interferase family)